jgi:hypothetical protein
MSSKSEDLGGVTIEINDGVATLACNCGRSKKCPTVELRDGFAIIHDDFGGSVRIPEEQAALIPTAIYFLEQDKRTKDFFKVGGTD